MVAREALVLTLNELLQPDTFQDYCPNGLQVSGKEKINTIVSGVTACEALITAALLQKADVLLVHHGLFWRGEDLCIVGMKKNRIAKLLASDCNLLAYHLPLDAHPTVGNNAQLGAKLGFTDIKPVLQALKPTLVFQGCLAQPMSWQQLSSHMASVLQRQPLVIAAGSDKPITKIAWCTGAAQNRIDIALAAGVDAYITGEASEQTVHVAREMGLHFFAAGHHATERYGVQALGEHLAQQFAIKHVFIDIDNPV